MEYKNTIYVDEDQNIVTRIELIETPQEYLTRNGQVFHFAESMTPGQMLAGSRKITREET